MGSGPRHDNEEEEEEEEGEEQPEGKVLEQGAGVNSGQREDAKKAEPSTSSLHGEVTSSYNKEIGVYDNEMESIEREVATLEAAREKLKGRQGEIQRAKAKKVRQRDRYMEFLKQLEEDDMDVYEWGQPDQKVSATSKNQGYG